MVPQALNMSRRILQLFVGLMLYGLGIVLMVNANVGLSPWDVLAQGLSFTFPQVSFGMFTIIVSIVVLLLWIPLRQPPGFGTIANALLIGVFVEWGFLFVPKPPDLLWAWISFTLGLVTIGLATGMYIGARFGPGPRDGLMTGLHRVTGRPIWMVRTLIEVIVLGIGWLLGGNVGLGTVAFALLIGPLAGFFMPLLLVPAAPPRTDAEPGGEGTAPAV